MELRKCDEVFNETLIFDFDVDTPIINLSEQLDDDDYDWVNSDLKEILVTNNEAVSIEYLLNRQDRYLSPLVNRLIDHYGEDHLGDVCTRIANILITKFMKSWSKLADAVFGDYNPIENYNMKENRKTNFEEHTVTDSSETVTNKYSGFNSDEMKDVSESSTDGNIDTTKTDTGTSANNELTRSGNIGVTTSQQMVESSYNLAKKNLLDVIYKDIDTILFIDYYC